MDFWGFIGEFFLKPIDEHSGYNVYNTLAYAALAIAAAYLIFRLLKRLGIKIDARFAYSIIPFILLGSALRVAADAIDPAFPATAAWSAARSPILAAVSAAGINLYALFASPGVYLIVGPLTLACVLLASRLGRMDLLPWAGALMLAFPLLAILPLSTNFIPLAAVLALALAGLAAGAAAISALRKTTLFGGGWSLEPGARSLGWVAVFSHAMDGAATFVSIDLFRALGGATHSLGGYGEQHVLANALASFGGFASFYLVKIAFATAVVFWLAKSGDVEEDEKYYVLLLITIFGLAPATRDSLRLLCGV